MASDPYKRVRGFLGAGSHMEVASGSGKISLEEARARGLVESGTTDTSQDGISDPEQKHTHVGVHLPGAAKPPVDVRPQVAYGDEGRIVGTVTAVITPKNERQDRGALPEYEIRWDAQRVSDPAGQRYFDSESEAKSFVADGTKVKWYRPANPDPWEALVRRPRVLARALRALVTENDRVLRSCFRFVRALREEDDGEADDSPYAICNAELGDEFRNDDGEISAKGERCVKDVKKQFESLRFNEMKIDHDDVYQAALKSAKSAYKGRVSTQKLKGMVQRAIEMASDTEEAIGIVQSFFQESSRTSVSVAEAGRRCPGGKKRSKGKGRGMGRGEGSGPVGIPPEEDNVVVVSERVVRSVLDKL